MVVNSGKTRLRIFSLRRRSAFSQTTRVRRAGCTWNPLRTREPLATSGLRTVLLSLKVLAYPLSAFLVSDIFSDVYGRLEGESIVGEAIQDSPNLWYIEEPPLHPALRPLLLLHWNSHSPAMIAGVRIQDWREPIHQMLRTLQRGPNVDFNIRITVEPPRKSTLSYSVPSSPIVWSRFRSSDDSLVTISLPQSRPTPLRIQIHLPSPGPPTPSTYRTAMSTPVY
jgi:hypothetical protein